MTAESAYISALFGVAALILWAAAVDITLYYRSEPTISSWLRAHQPWILWPMVLTLVFVAVLMIHLLIFS